MRRFARRQFYQIWDKQILRSRSLALLNIVPDCRTGVLRYERRYGERNGERKRERKWERQPLAVRPYREAQSVRDPASACADNRRRRIHWLEPRRSAALS